MHALALQFTEFGAPDVLRVVDLEVPEPGPGQVRIRVEASSVQFTDTLIRRGMYPDLRGRPPFTPGYDCVGRVDAVGEGVDLAVGSRVADLTMVGGNARYILRPSDGLVPVPESVDAAEAAALVLSWTTAQQALFRTGELTRGERLLVIGGNGAVGLAAIALAVDAGAEVYATASPEHHARIEALGATPLPRDDWSDTIEALGGVDVVLDGVGADRFLSSFRALRAGGRLVGIGVSAAAATGSTLQLLWTFLHLVLFLRLVPGSRSSRFYSITSERKRDPQAFRADLTHLFALLEADRIHPTVAERIGWDRVADTHARLEAGGLLGKVVLLPEG